MGATTKWRAGKGVQKKGIHIKNQLFINCRKGVRLMGTYYIHIYMNTVLVLQFEKKCV